jgi:hypothetical protein
LVSKYTIGKKKKDPVWSIWVCTDFVMI